MKVTIGTPELVSEQTTLDGVGAHQLIGEIETLDQWTDIVPGVRSKAEAIVQRTKDGEPEFPIIRVEEGWSNSGRLWDGECLDVIAEQITEKEPVGNLGHLKEEEMATAFGEPQTVWLGAVTKTEPSQSRDRLGENVKVLYAKGYNLPNAKVRTYLRTKAVRGVSWLGFAEVVPVRGKGVAVKARTFQLKALDWARKLAEGMPTSSVVAIASEMEVTKVGDKNLSQVTPEEFKQENPNGFQLLVSEAVREKDTRIAEMEEEAKESKKASDLLANVRKELGIADDADPLEAIAQLSKKLGEEATRLVDKALDKVLEKKVPDEANRAVVKRLLTVSEMEAKAKDAKDEAEVEKLVGEMVGVAFDNDDLVKRVVSEQTPPNTRRREDLRSGGGSDDSLKDNPYAKREVRSVA